MGKIIIQIGDESVEFMTGNVRQLSPEDRKKLIADLEKIFNNYIPEKRPNDFDDGSVLCSDGKWRNYFDGEFLDGYKEGLKGL